MNRRGFLSSASAAAITTILPASKIAAETSICGPVAIMPDLQTGSYDVFHKLLMDQITRASVIEYEVLVGDILEEGTNDLVDRLWCETTTENDCRED